MSKILKSQCAELPQMFPLAKKKTTTVLSRTQTTVVFDTEKHKKRQKAVRTLLQVV